jgi:hypothetical protein
MRRHNRTTEYIHTHQIVTVNEAIHTIHITGNHEPYVWGTSMLIAVSRGQEFKSPARGFEHYRWASAEMEAFCRVAAQTTDTSDAGIMVARFVAHFAMMQIECIINNSSPDFRSTWQGKVQNMREPEIGRDVLHSDICGG